MLLKNSITIHHRWPANLSEDDINDYKGEQVYNTKDSYLKELNNVWISPDSVVYKNIILIEDTLAATTHLSYYKHRYFIKKYLFSKRVKLDDRKRYLLATDYWSAGHFHWICDVLPKLVSIRSISKDFILLLPDSPYIRNIAIESIKHLNIEFEDIFLMSDKAFYKAKSLYYVTKIAESGKMHSELMKELQQSFQTPREGADKKIYITRGKASRRKILNEPELCNLLIQYKYQVLFSEELTLQEHIDVFSSCHTLIGLHGGGLSNCVFMPPGSNVVELRKKENGPHNVGFWHLADSLDHKYYYYNGIPDCDKPLVGGGSNLTIPLKDFEEKILGKL